MLFQSRQFTYNKASGVMSAEISDIVPGNQPLFNRANRCLSIVSHKTGATEMFRLVLIEKDTDQDILAWHFSPIKDTIKAKVVVYND